MNARQKRINDEWHRLMGECQKRGVKIVDKTTPFWLFLGRALSLIGNKHFVDGYITTIGTTIAVPPGWMKRWTATPNGCSTIAHELVHVEQFKRFGLGNANLGVLPMAILYLLLPLPFGFAWFRWRLERVAYLAGDKLRASLVERELDNGDKARVFDQLTGPGYGFAMFFARGSVAKWLDENYK